MFKWLIVFYKWLFDIKEPVVVQPVSVLPQVIQWKQPEIPTIEEVIASEPQPPRWQYRMTYKEWVENNKMIDQLRAS